MTNLLGHALQTLRDEAAPHGFRSLAAVTLLAAMEDEIDVPSCAPLAVWEWLCGAGRDTVRLSRIGRIPGDDVLERALAVLREPNAGDALQELATTVIENSTDLSTVTDDDILAILDGEPGPDRARRLTWIVEAIHTNRGIPNAILQGLRDRWSRSRQVRLRVQAVAVARHLPGVDVTFVTKVLGDRSPKVRSAAAELLERAEGKDREEALRLLQDQLRSEEHVTVRGDLHLAIGSLLRATNAS